MNRLPAAKPTFRGVIYAACLALLVLGCILVNQIEGQSNAEVHTRLELANTMVALFIGALAMVRFYSKKDNAFLFVATGFIGTGLLDGYHAVVSAAPFKVYFPSPPPSLIAWSGFAPRLFLAVLLVLSWLFWRREVRLQESGRVSETLVLLLVGGWTVACFCFFALVPLPLGYRAILPVFHRPQEALPALLYLLALIAYLSKGEWRRDAFEHWLVLAIILCFGQSMFMATSDKLYDLEHIGSHVLKLSAYLCALAGLMITTYDLVAHEEKVIAERTGELQREIAERTRAEESLKLFRVLLDRSTDAIEVGDPESLRCFDVNQKACADLGYTREELLSLSVPDVDGQASEPEHRNKVNTQLQKSGAALFEGVHRRKDGSTFPVEVALTYVSLDRKYFVSIVRDITERKRADAELLDHERCLAGGMDGYVAKPLNLAELKRELQRVTAGSNSRPSPRRWKPEQARAQTGGDDELLREVVGIFLEETPKLLSAIQVALASHDAPVLRQQAHTLKGQLGCIAASEAAQAAQRLEQDAGTSDWEAAAQDASELRQTLARLEPELKSYCEVPREAVAGGR